LGFPWFLEVEVGDEAARHLKGGVPLRHCRRMSFYARKQAGRCRRESRRARYVIRWPRRSVRRLRREARRQFQVPRRSRRSPRRPFQSTRREFEAIRRSRRDVRRVYFLGCRAYSASCRQFREARRLFRAIACFVSYGPCRGACAAGNQKQGPKGLQDAKDMKDAEKS
jgi:hypothetical protein